MQGSTEAVGRRLVRDLDIQAELSRQRESWQDRTRNDPYPPLLSWEDWLEAILAFTHHMEHEFMVRGAMLEILTRSKGRPGFLVLEDLMVLTLAAHARAWDFPDLTDEEPDMV